jgi:low affinity Fe/Cu permease
MKDLQNILESELKNRDTEVLKSDIKEAMNSEDESSNLIFVIGLNVLEERLTKKEYDLFEDSL